MKLRRLILCALLLLGGWLWLSAQDSKESSPPAITVKLLENRLAELQRSREQLVANIHAHDGAIEECQYWIRWLKEKEE